RVAEGGVFALAPRGVDRTERAVDGVAEFVDANALVVVAVNGKIQQVFLSKTGGFAASAAHALVLVGRVRVVPVFGHVGINLVLADDDKIHVVLDHRLDNVGPARQQMSDDGIGA